MEGSLYTDESDGGIYVLLKTKLGYICVSLKTGTAWGGIQRTEKEALYGLDPLGYKLQIDNTPEGKRPYNKE